jgi:endonuclease-3
MPDPDVEKIIDILDRTYPEARQELNFSSPFELLIATILAAQCTDARVNEVTVDLFRKYKKPEDYMAVPVEQLQQDIRRISFYRNKSKGILSACKMLVKMYNGEVPHDVESLVELPFVGRKTANIVLSNAFGIPAIGVDTHTIRVPNRLGWVSEQDPDKVERALCDLIPKSKWHRGNIVIQWHGRYTCVARKPKCGECAIFGFCAWKEKDNFC